MCVSAFSSEETRLARISHDGRFASRTSTDGERESLGASDDAV
jgi:hypothetical protein